MGYFGLKEVADSDNAADLLCDVEYEIFKKLKSGFRRTRRENVLNTPGAVNVCLILESGILDGFKYLDDEWLGFLYEVRDDMNQLIEDAKDPGLWREYKDRIRHLKAFQRMLRKLNQVIKRTGR